MFSEEFMRYLINYQNTDKKNIKNNETMTVPFTEKSSYRKLAAVLLTVKK